MYWPRISSLKELQSVRVGNLKEYSVIESRFIKYKSLLRRSKMHRLRDKSRPKKTSELELGGDRESDRASWSASRI